MQTIEVRQGQSFFDVALVATGDVTNVFQMAVENNISVTDLLQPGNNLIVSGALRTPITKLFSTRNYPATAIQLETQTNNDGIDYVFPYILPMT